MKELIAIFFALVVIVISTTTQTALAEEHGVADGSCDPLCAAEIECRILVDTIDNELDFYIAVENSERSEVRSNCIFGVGLMI
jgi:hypothetical protein